MHHVDQFCGEPQARRHASCWQLLRQQWQHPGLQVMSCPGPCLHMPSDAYLQEALVAQGRLVALRARRCRARCC